MPEPKYFLMMPNTDHSTILGMLQFVPAMCTYMAYTLTKTPLPSASWTISESTGDIKAFVKADSVMQGDHSVFAPPELKGVTMWYATTCTKGSTGDRRDFRYSSLDAPCECGVANDGTCFNKEALSWTSKELVAEEDGSYVAHMEADPMGGWTGFFIDFTFEDPRPVVAPGALGAWPVNSPGSLDMTTEVSIWPNTFPFEECSGEGCYGTLL